MVGIFIIWWGPISRIDIFCRLPCFHPILKWSSIYAYPSHRNILYGHILRISNVALPWEAPESILTIFDFASTGTVVLQPGSFWWLKVLCNSDLMSLTSFFLSKILSHHSSRIWTCAFVFAIFSATFNLSVWNISDCLSSIYLASAISSAILIFSARACSWLEDLLLLLDLKRKEKKNHGIFLN